MKTICFFLILISLVLSMSCTRDSQNLINDEEFKLLYEQFNGKYAITQASSDTALDINQDGIVSNNLFDEIKELPSSHLEIRVLFDNVIAHKNSGIFEQFWPEQYLILDGKIQDIDQYNSAVLVNYLVQGAPRYCNIHQSEKKIDVLVSEYIPSTPKRWTLPTVVTIEDNNTVRIVQDKAFYTKIGWKTTKVTSTYTRVSKEL